MRLKREQLINYVALEAQELSEEWTTQDAYVANLPEENRVYLFCDHCRSTLVVRPFLYDGELYMECQVCGFTYRNNGLIKEIFKGYSG